MTAVNRTSGYVQMRLSNPRRTAYEHRVIVERAIGRPLKSTEQVHHVDEDRTNNAQSNLVACQDNSYHKLIERRTAAFSACGNANWRKCKYCHEYEDPARLSICNARGLTNGLAYHKRCAAEHMRRRSA